MRIAEIIIDRPNDQINRAFDYIIPDNLNIEIGDRVIVPFGGTKKLSGFCIAIKNDSEFSDKLKPIIDKPDEYSLLTPETIELMYFMADTFHIRYIDSIRLCVHSSLRQRKVKDKITEFVFFNKELDFDEVMQNINKGAKKQIELLEYIKDKKNGIEKSLLNKKYAPSTISALIEKNFLIVETRLKEIKGVENHFKLKAQKHILTKDQNRALEEINKTKKQTVLLKGVTGSGKTEIYMRLVEQALLKGKTAIMLVPEISLTPQTVANFKARFGDRTAVLHSALTATQRNDEWMRIVKGEADIVIGARSAIFAPLKNIGIIIIDEEHDNSYTSNSNPRYDAISVAQFRAGYNNCKLLLGTATPSVESYHLAKEGEYLLVTMNNRVNNVPLPKFEFIDMRTERIRSGEKQVITNPLADAIRLEIEKGNQVMLFLNRRGWASFVKCKNCGYVAKCTECDVSLVYHSRGNQLQCHYCNKRFRMLTHCPDCKSDQLTHGFEGTENVENEIREMVPGVKILRLDRDTTTRKDSYFKILKDFQARKAQVLVGTQMITKGHDFPDVTLVGVIDADLSLYMPTYRANEITFQLLTQVAGRCGRADKPGRVLVQTHRPGEPVLISASKNDYEEFYKREINVREATEFPPFSTIVRVLISGANESLVEAHTRNIYKEIFKLKKEYENEIIHFRGGPALRKRIQAKYRYEVSLRMRREHENEVLQKVYKIIDNIDSRGVSIFVDINPIDIV